MPSERQSLAQNGRSDRHTPVIVATRERAAMPGTPSRKERQRESSALQDPGLKDYVRRIPFDDEDFKLQLLTQYFNHSA